MENVTDLFVIGGGINGTAIAADASGRGLAVTLCEKGDLAAGTSSASTKLIHGGLRYLELYEFNLVRHALHECDVLMKRAPNLIRPLEFILPHEKHQRSFWLIRLGLFLYDHLAKRHLLPHSRVLNLKKNKRGKVLKAPFKKGFSYYDCFTDDSRLVILNALAAKERDAKILTHTHFISACRKNSYWEIQLKNVTSGKEFFYYAKALINAAGPWVNEVQQHIQSSHLKMNIELVKGSHIILPKLYDGDFAYILQNADHRIVFAIPYQHDFTLAGTTDVAYDENLNDVVISENEKNYLCHVINYYFKKNISPLDIVSTYSGVRCLQGSNEENLSEITRDYKLLFETEDQLPLLSVIGGKLTTHRILAEDALNQLQAFFPEACGPWTASTPLPGCGFENQDFTAFYLKLRNDYDWVPENILSRYAKNYGNNTYRLLNGAKNLADLGKEFTAGLYQKEIEYLIQYEWAETAEDILWRRTKLGLYFSEKEVKKLNDWLVQTHSLSI